MIELTKENKNNVLELYVAVYHEPSVFDHEKLDRLLKIIGTELTDREEQVLILRYGLDGNGMKTIAETAAIFGVGRERLRQIEAKAIKKLMHSARRQYIFGELGKPKENNYSLSTELKDTELSARTIACLRRVNVTTIGELLNVKLVVLLSEKNLGKKSFQQIVNFIKKNKELR